MSEFSQMSLFDCLYENYVVKNPIRLIELFAGYGSQALALKYLNAKFEHYRICEWSINSIQCYNDLHIRDYKDYSKDKTKNVSKTTVLKFLVKYAKKAGLKNADKYHFHMFRHGEATLLDSIGIDDNVVSKVLRHSSSEITKKVYIHETENEFKEVQNVLNSFEKDFK